MSERWKMPPERDFKFYQRKKHDKWLEVAPPDPALEAPVADSHAHVHNLPDPAWELIRCAANGVRFVCEICDPSEDELNVPEDVRQWQTVPCDFELPKVRISAGVHPHNAKLYDEEIEALLLKWLAVPETLVVGEIGLDYHYDLSPRETQRQVFRRQIQIAKDLDMPISLHLRGGDDSSPSNAHCEAFEILQEAGFPSRGTILHCCSLPPEELRPWIDAGCYIAYGGALTFANSEAARQGALTVPEDRLLLETDSPYMTPVPMRSSTCTPSHVIFTAARLAEIRGVAPGPDRERFLAQLFDNTAQLFGCDAR